MRSGGLNKAAFAGLRFVGTSVVVAERESQHDGQPEDGTDDHKLGAFGTVTGVHEVENDESGFDSGDAESDDDIEFAEVLEGGPHGEAGAEHQGCEDKQIDFWRNNVLGHATLLPVPVNQV